VVDGRAIRAGSSCKNKNKKMNASASGMVLAGLGCSRLPVIPCQKV